ncbi:MAG TPA: hypothetical protein PLO52_00420 [Flavobacterium alvei]|nr:hypothetical protein [Flavobacterium alvei]
MLEFIHITKLEEDIDKLQIQIILLQKQIEIISKNISWLPGYKPIDYPLSESDEWKNLK